MLRFFFFLNFFFVFLLLGAQVPATYFFTHYGIGDGLASNEVFDVKQDHTGYLWIATNNGLQRYDGVHYKNFRYHDNDPKSLPSNVIIKLFVDAKDNLWIITHSGQIGLFDKNTFTYKEVPVMLKNQGVVRYGQKRLIADEYGNLFLSIRGNDVLRYNEQKKQFVSIADFIPVKPGWGITSLSQQPGTHKYWMGLQTGGLVIYNRKTGHLNYLGHNIDKEPAIEVFGPKSDFAFSFFDKQGRVWFQQWGGGFPYAMQYDPARKNEPLKKFEFITTLKTYHELWGFIQLSNGMIGVHGTKLFALFNDAEGKFQVVPNDYRSEQGINYQTVTTLFEDREKNVWVPTQENGLYRFNPSMQFFTNISHTKRDKAAIGEGSVMSFIETKEGNLLTGAWEDGPFHYTSELKNIPLAFRNADKIGVPYMWSFCTSADSNTIWIGAQPSLYQYDQQKGTLRYRNPLPIRRHTVRQVVEDKKGNLWLGMHGIGVFRMIDPKNPKKDSVIKVTETGDALINHMVVDNNNRVWVATGFDGLFVFDGYTGRLFKHWKTGTNAEGNLIGNSVMALLNYNDSLMLIGTIGNLFFYNRNTDKIVPLPLQHPFIGNISAMQKEDDGFLWVGTTNALYRIHPQKKVLVYFNRLDGMLNDRFNLSASYKMKDGRLLFGTANSFICFDPRKIRSTDMATPIVFTGIQAGKSDLRIDSVVSLERLTLDPQQNSLNITFSSLSYSFAEPVQYKMQGIDDEWKIASKDNRVSYPFLPAGHHTLLLRTVNAEGVPNETPTVLQIRVIPPFYQAWWFYTLLAVFVALFLYRLDRQRNKRKEAMQKVRTDIATGLHQDVNTALNNINILSEIARLKSDREPQKAKEYLEQIHSKSHNMIIALDDMLWSLDPMNDAMDKTIARIKEFVDALMQRHNVLIELLIDKKVEKLQLNMKMRHEAFLLFKEGLRSLIEAGTRHCIVHLTSEKAKLLFTIEFDNEGCDMQKLNNLLHRRDMEARIQALGAKLNVQLHKSKSVFLLQLPLVN